MPVYTFAQSLLCLRLLMCVNCIFETSGPVLVMVLEKRNAVSDWRGLIGPTDAQKAKISHPHRFGLFPNTFLLWIPHRCFGT